MTGPKAIAVGDMVVSGILGYTGSFCGLDIQPFPRSWSLSQTNTPELNHALHSGSFDIQIRT